MTEKAQEPAYSRRRDLLPLWIKIFIWLFILFGAATIVSFILSLLNYQFQISLYGMSTNRPTSPLGITLTILFLFKSFVAISLWTEKNYAIAIAKIDALIALFFCLLNMFVFPFLDDNRGFEISLRLELLIIVPYLIKLNKIKEDWKKLASPQNNG